MTKAISEMNWVSSGGGPLICATPSAGANWRGINGSSVGFGRNDYERACDETDYVGVIPSGTLEVLVLGDEPLQSVFVKTGHELAIVRWVSCVSLEQAKQVIASMPSQLPAIADQLQFLVREHSLCLFDSAIDMQSLADYGSCIGIKPGQYFVTTERYQREHEFDFLVHRIIE